MKRWTGWVAVAAAGVSALLACSSGNGNSGGATFSGPSCPSGQQPGSQGQGDQACNQCVQSNCSSTDSCVTSDCSDYLSCFCACAQGDVSCYQGCQSKQTPACQTCMNQGVQCEQQKCASACGSGSSSGGGTPDAGGGSMPTGNCATLATCCAGITDPNEKQGCTGLANTNNQSACQMGLAAFQDAGVCP